MTREEAAIKLMKTHYTSNEAYHLINALEALGLIKFGEEKKEKPKYIFFPHPDNTTLNACKDNVSVLLEDVILTLERYGYNVFKKTANEKPPINSGDEVEVEFELYPKHKINNENMTVKITGKFVGIKKTNE